MVGGSGIWQAGLTPKSARLYAESPSCSDYVTDLDEQYAKQINGSASELADDKQRFCDLLRDRGDDEFLPEESGELSQGSVGGMDLLDLVNVEGRLVVKDRTGVAGDRVHILVADSDGYELNGTPISAANLRSYTRELDGYLVAEYCYQAEYIDAIYPRAANTIRVVMMMSDGGEPFIARAVHRIGTSTSGAVDNFSQGGLSAVVRAHGTTGSAVRYLNGEASWHDTRPDTGDQIEGVHVPGWTSISEAILSIASDIPELPYLGWDIIVTGKKQFSIIEANSNTDIDLLQAHGPLLADERVHAFYIEQSVID